jgi:hypothetical protein
MWLARAGQVVQAPVRGIGVEGAVLGKALQMRNGVAMIAVYYPAPEAPGEPFYSVLTRAANGEIRCFVFEYGITEPGVPPRVVMAEYRTLGDNSLGDKGSQARIRFDVEGRADAHLLEFCLTETARVVGAPPAPMSAFEAAMAAANAAAPAAIGAGPSQAPPQAPPQAPRHASACPPPAVPAAPYRGGPAPSAAPTAGYGGRASSGPSVGMIVLGGGAGVLIVGAYLAWFLLTR